MRSVKFLVAVGAASLFSSVVFAADMPIAPPPMPYAPPPAEFSGWYLRGDIGMTNQSMKSIDSNAAAQFPTTQVGLGFDSSPSFQLGVGYQFNNWFRTDFTAQYRGKANLHGSNGQIFTPTAFQSDNYFGSKSELLFLANAYVDLGTWWCITPFIGFGVGSSYNMVSGFRDENVQIVNGVTHGAVATFANNGTWNFAWAAHAGLAYKVTPSVTLEVAYSYLDLGSARPGNFTLLDGTTGASSIVLRDITSHDLTLGVRWNFDAAPVYMPPPLVTKG
ncbi:outer membrane beta-barrel protein [Bradyrhizobium sp. NP1]|uniref:outer membrane protein n=1 Tax=Bradyrhizobium sp. NP1 TaxID=3049772 RepID=UPI0025A4DDE2|nr:outer membrane beta-barrel protein [Bradyrhizobium sp. NP1]WJR79682.1 outer membrane beta-barrel protein [Bradyrhizobium sp. NP1]